MSNCSRFIAYLTLPIFFTAQVTWAAVFHTDSQPTQSFFLHTDHLGSASVVTDGAGQVAQRTTYLPYGLIATETGTLTLPHKFTGKRLDKELGLYDFGARAYDPAFSRFLTPDTAGRNYEGPHLDEVTSSSRNESSYTMKDCV